MACYKSNYLDNKILNAIMNHTTYTPPTTLFVALFTTIPTAAGTGGVEVSGNAYARASVTANTTNFLITSTQSISNATVISFPSPTGTWGTITSFALMDASTSGNFLYIGSLTTPFTAILGSFVQFQVGKLTVTEA